MTTMQEYSAHAHGGLEHLHNHHPGDGHDHTPQMTPMAAKKALAGQDWYRATVASLVSRKHAHLPLWVRALEAWTESRYPVGRHGYAEARAVMEQVILHYEQEAELAARRTE